MVFWLHKPFFLKSLKRLMLDYLTCTALELSDNSYPVLFGNWTNLSAIQYNYGHKNIISILYIALACTFFPLMLMEFLLHPFGE